MFKFIGLLTLYFSANASFSPPSVVGGLTNDSIHRRACPSKYQIQLANACSSLIPVHAWYCSNHLRYRSISSAPPPLKDSYLKAECDLITVSSITVASSVSGRVDLRL
jgi:hypothetical protein